MAIARGLQAIKLSRGPAGLGGGRELDSLAYTLKLDGVSYSRGVNVAAGPW